MTLSRQLANFIVSTNYENLPKDVVEFTKLCFLDWLGSAIGGESKAPIRIIREMVLESGGHPQATLISGEKSSVANAALYNGAASHVLELDDIHKASIIHAATVVIPAALAVAQWKGKSGKDLIAAIAIGYDVSYRIGEAVSPSHYYYWHNTATCGTFGAAAAAAKLLDLDAEQTVMALGSAGTQAAGLWEFIEDGAMSKQLHTGKAAMNGVISALLGGKNFTSATRILEGNRGFFKAMSSETDGAAKITDRLGEIFKITENSFKVHASCRHTHPVVDLVLEIGRELGGDYSRIKRIDIQTYGTVIDITDNPIPKTLYEAKFSVQFCAALAIVRRSAGLLDFTDETLHHPDIRNLIGKINVSVDPEINGMYPEKWGARVVVELTSGERLTRVTEFPKGDPENPVQSEDLVQKFKAITADLSASDRDYFIDTVMKLEQFRDLREFFPAGKRVE
ncbi:MmgE/PrpD family protein [Ferviditalea candida]|uniref:MmgE/PrpD family protein n=1 Tax=Ferviditalea candida TaxID=3108399 RepID=A0ABU5ZP05_9BACL|nr:MmgE/PrpD family protein [Paenibacillaceae bacterium T2]